MIHNHEALDSGAEHDTTIAAEHLDAAQVVRIVYTNYRNETTVRSIIPDRLWFGSTPWHPKPQWLLDAFDVEKGEKRSFAVADIRSWSAS